MPTEVAAPVLPAAPAPVVADVAEDLVLVARSPDEMRAAQDGLSQWFEAKIEICRRDSADLEESLSIATLHKIPTDALRRQANLMAKRVEFYKKCKAAVDAGFCIVPNFPVDVFAIRTDRRRPSPGFTTSWSATHKQPAPGLPAGEGEYKDPDPIILTDRQPSGRKDVAGKEIVERVTWAERFRGEIEFPISISRPEVLGEVARAMAGKVFDEIGISPSRTVKKKDPIVVGRIKDPRSTKENPRFVTFLLAWWLNTADL